MTSFATSSKGKLQRGKLRPVSLGHVTLLLAVAGVLLCLSTAAGADCLELSGAGSFDASLAATMVNHYSHCVGFAYCVMDDYSPNSCIQQMRAMQSLRLPVGTG